MKFLESVPREVKLNYLRAPKRSNEKCERVPREYELNVKVHPERSNETSKVYPEDVH